VFITAAVLTVLTQKAESIRSFQAQLETAADPTITGFAQSPLVSAARLRGSRSLLWWSAMRGSLYL
jgi:hypothetical protein